MTAKGRKLSRKDWASDPALWSGRIEGETLGTGLTLLLYASEIDGDAVPEHVHAYDEIFVLREGRLRFTIGDETIDASPGDILLGPAGLPHAFERRGPGRAESFSIHLSPRFAWANPAEVRPRPGAEARRIPQTDWEREPNRWSGRIEGRRLGTEATVLFFSSDEVGAGPYLHVHEYDELFIIREGRARFTVGDEVFDAGPGDVVFGPAKVPHKFANLGPGRLETTDLHLSDHFAQVDLEGPNAAPAR